jgi:hypothetical protein
MANRKCKSGYFSLPVPLLLLLPLPLLLPLHALLLLCFLNCFLTLFRTLVHNSFGWFFRAEGGPSFKDNFAAGDPLFEPVTKAPALKHFHAEYGGN